MIIDPSAVFAILHAEPDAATYAEAIGRVSRPQMAALGYLELCMVVAGKKTLDAIRKINDFIAESGIEIVPFSADASRAAVQAFMIYGKGRGHKAQLDFGDCISYAMSKTELMPLLFKGDGFRHTDVEAAL